MEISEVIKNIRSQLSLSQEGLARELHMGFTFPTLLYAAFYCQQ